jgi:hypothetical protein
MGSVSTYCVCVLITGGSVAPARCRRARLPALPATMLAMPRRRRQSASRPVRWVAVALLVCCVAPKRKGVACGMPACDCMAVQTARSPRHGARVTFCPTWILWRAFCSAALIPRGAPWAKRAGGRHAGATQSAPRPPNWVCAPAPVCASGHAGHASVPPALPEKRLRMLHAQSKAVAAPRRDAPLGERRPRELRRRCAHRACCARTPAGASAGRLAGCSKKGAWASAGDGPIERPRPRERAV